MRYIITCVIIFIIFWLVVGAFSGWRDQYAWKEQSGKFDWAKFAYNLIGWPKQLW